FGDKVPKGRPRPVRCRPEECKELAQREELRRVLDFHGGPVSAEAQLVGSGADPGPNRVQHDIANGLEEMLVAFNRPPGVVVPKEMTVAPVLPIHPAGMATVQELHAGSEALFSRSYQQVIVIRHQAISNDAPPRLE